MENTVIDKVKLARFDEIIASYDNEQSNLLRILQDVQGEIAEHYIPEDVAKYVGMKLDVPTSKVYDVITFFSALSDKPKGEHVIQLCKSSVCRLNKYQTVRDVLESELNISMGETTPDNKFTLEYTACFGACDISPALRIDEKIYGHLNEAKVKEIIQQYREV